MKLPIGEAIEPESTQPKTEDYHTDIWLQGRCATILCFGYGFETCGHQVTVAANENFESFVRQCDLEFAAIAPNMQEFLQSKKGMRLIAGEKLRLEDEEKLLRQQLQSAWVACQDAEVIIYTPLANWGYHIAEKLEIPCFMASVVLRMVWRMRLKLFIGIWG